MTYKIEFLNTARKQLFKIDKLAATEIVKFLKKLESSENIRTQGKPLLGDKRGLWRYRVGKYRIICEIQDQNLIVLVIRIAHRRDVYK